MLKQYFVILNCILIIFAAYLGVTAAYDTVLPQLESLEPQLPLNTKKTSPSNTNLRPLTYYRGIEKRNLFNVTGKKTQSPAPVNLASLEQTDLKLKLWGTVSGSDKEAYAVIEDTKVRSQDLYRKGDTVQNAEVKMILRGKVVLRVDGKDEILEMEESISGPDTKRAAPVRRTVSRSPGTQKISLKRGQIDAALENINNLMQEVRIMPHFDNGQPDGFRVSGIKPNSLFRKMGLRNGDIILGVNGNKIETMDDALGFYQQLNTASDIVLQMKRRGRERNIEYKID